MSLNPGTRLGPYEIVSPLGAGGMGEVYKARDTRLDRTVAIKVLPAVLAMDPEFKARFAREAKSISALNHPNICTLHDVGESDEVSYLVLEYLEGETLGARLDRGALPLADALTIAIGIASALDNAHRQGVVHRDLKPGNIMLVRSGGARSDATQAKLLDFGLAKIGPVGTLSATAPTALATSPRPAAQPLTAQGTILGTFQYMAPEQIEGDEADARTDIFAFGAVLFEMLTGRRAFSGKSQASLIGAILKDEPPAVSQIAPVAPPALDHVVGACLSKDPDARFQTAHDVLLQLKWIAEGGSAAGIAAPAIAPRRRLDRFGWVVAAVLGVVCLGTAAITVRHLRETAPVVNAIRFSFGPAENSIFSGTGAQFAVSPDGRQVVFVASLQSADVLWVRALSSDDSRPLPGTEGAQYPFWSADSRVIGFFTPGKLKKVQTDGGPPFELCAAPNGRGGAWSSDNVILFAPDVAAPILRVSSAGGPPTPVTELKPGDGSHRWPAFLPDGRHFIFFAGQPFMTGEIRAGSLDSKEAVTVAASEANAQYASGHLMFTRDRSLLAQPFNPDTRQVSAEAFPVRGRIVVDTASHAAFSLSAAGVLAYTRGAARPTSRLTWFDRTGARLGTAGEPDLYGSVSLSPDQRSAAVSLDTGSPVNRDIWLIDLTREGGRSRLTFDTAADASPAWSPNGAQIGFTSNRGGVYKMYVKASGGGSQEELVLKSPGADILSDWSRDGLYLAYSELAPDTGLDLWVLPQSGERKPICFLRTPFNEDAPVFSPNGRWIAYTSNESRRKEVYVRQFPAVPGQGQYQVSGDGGTQPRWREDGGALYFLGPDGVLMEATTSTTADFTRGVPRKLFSTGVAPFDSRGQYAVAKDGKRFLVVMPEQHVNPYPITVVVNWLAALQK